MCLDAPPGQPARQPEPRPAGLVGGDHSLNRFPGSPGPVTVAVNGRQQRLGRRLNGLLRLDPRQAGNLCRQNPTRVTQLDRKHERLVIVDGDRMRK